MKSLKVNKVISPVCVLFIFTVKKSTELFPLFCVLPFFFFTSLINLYTPIFQMSS